MTADDTARADGWPLAALLVSEYRDQEGEVVNADATLFVGRSWADWITVELAHGDRGLQSPAAGSQVVRWDGAVSSFGYVRGGVELSVEAGSEEVAGLLEDLPARIDWIGQDPLPDGAHRQAPTGHFSTLWEDQADDSHTIRSSSELDSPLPDAVAALGLTEGLTAVTVDNGLKGIVVLAGDDRIPIGADLAAPGGFAEWFVIEATFDLSARSLELDAIDRQASGG